MILRYLGQSENREIQERMKEIEFDIEDAEEKKEKANATLSFVISLDKESIFHINIEVQDIFC